MAQVGSRGERLDIVARQGATLGPFVVTLSNPDGSFVNLTGCTIQGQVRKTALSSAVIAEFDVEISNPATDGKFTFGISHTVTATIPSGESQRDENSLYQWDMELVDSAGRIIPLYYGEYENFREVTRV